MTRPNLLVIDGNQVKLRLQADRLEYGSPVHVDWLRFTLPRRAVAAPSVDLLFPVHDNQWHEGTRFQRLSSLIASMPDCDVVGGSGMAFKPEERACALEAFQVADDVSRILGKGFSVAVEVRKGHDFYKFRWSIMRADHECGWVGFLASSSSPRQQAQARTIHVNLYGTSCTFGAFGWREKMADFIDASSGDITRCDLALDFFDGLPGGFDSVVQDYRDGLCNVNGKEPKCNMLGDWVHGHGRSFYFGSKEAGKQTNVYEKGDQLFGIEVGSMWHRIELRYGNKLRVLPTDILRRPADFFAGASAWHESMVFHASHQPVSEPVKCKQKLEVQTVQAEAARSLRWFINVALPTAATLLREGAESFVDLYRTTQIPARLARFTEQERRDALNSVFSLPSLARSLQVT